MDDWLEFLRDPVRPAALATVRADGGPHIAPIWFDLDGERIMFNTGENTVKGRNIRRTGRVALCVQDDRPPFSYVSITGTAEIIEDLEQVRLWAGRIGGRYMGAHRAEEYGARNGVPGELLIRVTPTNVVAMRDVAD
jgi:PPOX class probable F420-dependent enzyme